jgi:drug/metabolite transporter (DMT)-like permease
MSKRAYGYALLAAALFGAATPLSKMLLASVPAVQLAGLLYLGAALGVAPLVLRQRPVRLPWRCDGATRRRLAGAIFFGGVLGPILLLLGLQTAGAGSVSLWLNLEAAATALLGRFVFRDQLGRYGWLGAGGIILASVLLSLGEGAAGIRAGVLVALACISWAIDNHLTALIDGITPAQSTLWKGLAAGTVNLALGLWLAPFGMGPAALGGALLIGVFSYGASIVLYISSAQRLGATRSQLVFSTAPFFGLGLAVLLLGETLTAAQVVAGLIIAASVWALTQEQHAHDHHHHHAEHEHSHRHDDLHHECCEEHGHGPFVGRHCHAHAHVALSHAHAHLPDLHHRHDHG